MQTRLAKSGRFHIFQEVDRTKASQSKQQHRQNMAQLRQLLARAPQNRARGAQC